MDLTGNNLYKPLQCRQMLAEMVCIVKWELPCYILLYIQHVEGQSDNRSWLVIIKLFTALLC